VESGSGAWSLVAWRGARGLRGRIPQQRGGRPEGFTAAKSWWQPALWGWVSQASEERRARGGPARLPAPLLRGRFSTWGKKKRLFCDLGWAGAAGGGREAARSAQTLGGHGGCRAPAGSLGPGRAAVPGHATVPGHAVVPAVPSRQHGSAQTGGRRKWGLNTEVELGSLGRERGP